MTFDDWWAAAVGAGVVMAGERAAAERAWAAATAAERGRCARACELTEVVTDYASTPAGEEFAADRGRATLDLAARRIREGRTP